jgi:hypothetical protein
LAYPLLGLQAVGVGALAGDVRVLVVEVLGGRAHDEGGHVDELLGQEARVRVDLAPIGWWPMCSTPPAMTTSCAPTRIALAAFVMAVSAPAHMRSTA